MTTYKVTVNPGRRYILCANRNPLVYVGFPDTDPDDLDDDVDFRLAGAGGTETETWRIDDADGFVCPTDTIYISFSDEDGEYLLTEVL